ncbi:hypothetical protein GL263_08125 [Streptomyces durbertensis]|uniref:Uncharacterized protein n=1 Tax=Streptomyces durbertensis TaxID=2448886 RepID=A0ABR6EEM1_9ACTN|nr:hypothetical protein [Streptomyces durbertensis]MBB1243527.1 hypothetical protein [Streptomyces durbertensis]
MEIGDDARRLALRPVRYEFARARGDAYDDNWLVVRGEVSTPRGCWSFEEPCLLVDEARSLAAWLRRDGGRLEFTEPLLEWEREEAGRLRVVFAHEAAPAWCPTESRSEGWAVEFAVAAEELRAAADEWERLLVPLPPR